MQCSVVIPCHNGAELTAACIDSLLQQSPSADLEILVVDNASTDGTAALAQRSPRVRVVPMARNLGFAGGVNAGIRAATFPFVLVVNNDTQAAPNMLEELHRALVADPRIGATAPVSNHVKGPARLPLGDLGRDAEARAAIAGELAAGPALQDLDTLAGLCLLVRRATFDEVGLFDERFGHGNYEDDDFCLRLRLLGYRLVLARRAFLHHEGHATFRALGLPIHAELQKRRAQFAAKWQHDPAGRAVLASLRGDLAAAGAAALQARAIWPLWLDADWHLGQACEAAGEPAQAAAHYRALLRECPHHSDAAVALGSYLLATGPADAARRHLAWTAHQCHLTDAHQLHLLRRLGEQAHAEGRPAAAAASFRRALEFDAEDAALHNWLGASLLAAGDLAGAEQALHAAVDRGSALAHTNLGICELQRGRPERARHCFEHAARLLPDDRVASANCAAMRAMCPTTDTGATGR